MATPMAFTCLRSTIFDKSYSVSLVKIYMRLNRFHCMRIQTRKASNHNHPYVEGHDAFRSYARTQRKRAFFLKNQNEDVIETTDGLKGCFNCIVEFDVVSNGFYSSGKSVVLHTSFTSYLFNGGDDVVRSLRENSGPLPHLDHVFMTHKSPKNVAGILEVEKMRYVTNLHKTKFTIHGPEGVDCFVKTDPKRRSKQFAPHLSNIVNRHPPGQIYTDHSLTVHPVLFFNGTNHSKKLTAACAYKLLFKTSIKERISNNLLRLCVKPGPWLEDVVEGGKTVEVDGRFISPEDVLYGSDYDEAALVIECPTLQYLPDMLRNSKKLSRRSDGGKFVDVVIHLTPDAVVSHKKYQQWMSHFPQSTIHLVISESRRCVSLKTAWTHQVQMHNWDKNIFPLPYPRPMEECDGAVGQQQDSATNTLSLVSGSQYILRPVVDRGAHHTNTHPGTIASAREHFNNIERIEEVARSRVSLTDDSVPRKYPIVTILGTGASINSKTRNVTGILVETEKNKYILLDCGFGVIGQLRRLYGLTKTDEILRNLKAVFVSHGHLDHHGGVLAFLSARKEAFKGVPVPTLTFVLPNRLIDSYGKYVAAEFPESMKKVHFRSAELLEKCTSANQRFPSAIYAKFTESLGLRNVQTFKVRHAYELNCYGIRLEHKDWKMVYTGDTMPCKEVVEAADGVDLLIHEASFASLLVKDSQMKTHSTIDQAMDIAKEAGAKFTLLTHFSARYPYLPDGSERLMKATNVGVACDNMVLRPKDLPNTRFISLFPMLDEMYHLEDRILLLNKKLCQRSMSESGMAKKEMVCKLNEWTLEQRELLHRVRTGSE